jgi:hypothetical protein
MQDSQQLCILFKYTSQCSRGCTDTTECLSPTKPGNDDRRNDDGIKRTGDAVEMQRHGCHFITHSLCLIGLWGRLAVFQTIDPIFDDGSAAVDIGSSSAAQIMLRIALGTRAELWKVEYLEGIIDFPITRQCMH